MSKKHFITLSNAVILFFEENPESQSLSFGVWDNHNDQPDSYIGDLKNWSVEIYGNADLLLDELKIKEN